MRQRGSVIATPPGDETKSARSVMNMRRACHEVTVRGLGHAQPIRITKRIGFFKEGGNMLNILRLTRSGFFGLSNTAASSSCPVTQSSRFPKSYAEPLNVAPWSYFF